jgi:predicted SnoaL-like aldol condensation-catalyzing enzyme
MEHGITLQVYDLLLEHSSTSTAFWSILQQHNPLVGDGKQSFIDYFDRMQDEYPNKSIEFVRTIAEGNLVALHTHQTWPSDQEYVTMDFFRFDENGKIVEHWDAMQEIPDESANGNLMY